MKLPAVLDEIVRRTGKRQPLEAGRTALNGADGAGSFKKILETQMAAPAENAAPGEPPESAMKRKLFILLKLLDSG